MKQKMGFSLYYLAAICFYLVAILQFFGGSAGSGTVYLCVGSVFTCLGAGDSRRKGDAGGKGGPGEDGGEEPGGTSEGGR